jgi:2,3-bisphosphoglycerate-dependent phosphoglycerate mutase
MQLYFIRHGQSQNNANWGKEDYLHLRSEDPELTDIGQKQARILGDFLKNGQNTYALEIDRSQERSNFGITHLYSSMMIRAVATGTAVAEALDLPLVAWKDIHEWGGMFLEDDNGRHGRPGKNRAYFDQNFPNYVLPDWLGEEGWWNSAPFEPHEDRLPRARRVLDELLKSHGGTDDRVVFFSHGGFYRLFLTTVLGLPSFDGFWFDIRNVSMTRIDFINEHINLVYTNRVDFLPPDCITD